MRVSPLSSIAAKLFYLTTLLVVGSTAAINWKNSEVVRDQLSRQFQRIAIDNSENSGNAIESLLGNWEAQLRIVMQNAVNSDSAHFNQQLEQFLATDENFVAVQVFHDKGNGVLEEKAYQFTKREHNNFENVALNIVSEKLREQTQQWLTNKRKSDKDQNIFVSGLYRQLKIPVMRLARGYKVSNANGGMYWTVLNVWQTPLIATLKSSKNVSSIIIDGDARVFASKNLEEMKGNKTLSDLELVKMSREGVIRTGYRGGYFDKNGREWLGAYYRINKYNLTVLVQQDAASAYAAIHLLVMQTVKWGSFFVLLTVFFSYFGSTGMTRSLRELTMVTQKIAGGDFTSFVKPKARDEVGALSVSVNSMASQIQNLLSAQVQKARFEKELETAHAVQDTLFPKEERKKRGLLNVSGFSTPATECGGDWWGHFVDDEGVEYVFIADAMGHGVPAALVTAMAYSSCMTMISMMQSMNKEERSPKAILERFNKVLYDAVEGSISMTFFALVLDPGNGKMTFANAGHNFPVLLSQSEDDDRISKKAKSKQKSPQALTPISLKANGSILGVERDALFEEKTMVLRPGDKFVLFTDGLIECTSPHGQAWGRKLLLDKVALYGDKSAAEMKDALVNDAFTFFNKHPLNDDVTVVAVEFPQTVAKKMPPIPTPNEEDAPVVLDLGA